MLAPSPSTLASLFQFAVPAMFLLAPVACLATVFISAPYGRHVRPGWGPLIPARLAWIIMESPALWLSAMAFSWGWNGCHVADRTAGKETEMSGLGSSGGESRAAPVIMAFYLVHYVHRVVIYPLRMRAEGKTMPVLVMLLALCYNLHNGFMQGYQVGAIGKYPLSWLFSTQFLIGSSLFLLGFITNIAADSALLALRKSSKDTGYQIPRGPLFHLVSCPNYSGELLEWLGWAILTWSWAGFAFFVFACANLMPRAVSHHKWYLQKFEDYPKQRKAVVPFLL
ncbi:hypothetical protein CLOM_g1224 [Closterium sp. NIES-68]|nr:hypothetical protein CLOM_g1224 [Closterium sp. NIES-68]GJP71434.1 hypothetical protein CLOP_g2259 [Closterium sp. NIES-67]